ncbi:MAG: VanZ family protein, partial [Symploca sp. SIO2C1]|nr:VanZ family protein [Symploca sp. SIO2C1]
MNVRKLLNSSSKTNFYELMEQWSPITVACGILLVLVTTLFPFNFAFPDDFALQKIVSSFQNQSNLSDWLGNVLLFIPFGFGLACLLQKSNKRGIAAIMGVLFASFCLSLTVEILQIFLPARKPTTSDLLLNSVSGLLGCICWQRWKAKVFSQSSVGIEETRNNLSLQQLTVGLFGYLILAVGVSFALQTATNFSNWNDSFPLLLGNERTGNRPWQGSISQITLVKRAISNNEVASFFSEQSSLATIEDSLLASYQLIGKENYQDQTKQLPDLVWQGEDKAPQEAEGVLFSPNHWLATNEPATLLTQQLRETPNFTLSATIATADTEQIGVARILSLSGDPDHRNFTLGQKGTDLILRLRTPLTGENGTKPSMVIPDVFVDTDFHHLIITYDGSVLQFYVDQLNRLYSADLKSALSLFYLLKFPHWNDRLNVPEIDIYRIVYYGIIFIPLGIIITVISTIVRKRLALYILLIFGGISLPALLLEGVLAISSSR